jgi:transcriptional regulator with XRE-family HTH domain
MSEVMDTKKQADSFYWVEWMVGERERLGLSQADLAKETGLTRTTISDYELRQRPNPDIRALVKISKALGHSALRLPRLAGLIPEEIEMDPELEDILEALDDFSTDERKEILAYINFLRNQRRKR